jgi:cysteine desulfurase/selenocysteine lyase
MPVNVSALGCDFYAFWDINVRADRCTGALYVSKISTRYGTILGGGDMIRSASLAGATFQDAPNDLAGTPAIEAAVALALLPIILPASV